MTTLLRDLAYAVRTLRHNAGFALTAISTVALGFAASSREGQTRTDAETLNLRFRRWKVRSAGGT